MRAVVFANGCIPNIHQVRPLILDEDYIVSADGGLRYLRTLDLLPEWVVGDLDSVSTDDLAFINENNIEIKKFPIDKDQTDLELALVELASKGFISILVVGALGGRVDQTLANIGLIQLFAEQGIEIELDDGQDHVTLIESNLHIDGKAGDIVSLIPLCASAAGIRTVGLKFPLANEELLPQRTRGISNEMTGCEAEVSISSGKLLCIHTRKILEKEL